MKFSIKDAMAGARRAIMATAAFTCFAALGTGILSAVIWMLDRESLPPFAIFCLCFSLALGLITGVPIFLLRKTVSRHLFHLAATGAVGFIAGMGLLLGITYNNSCSALGWHYDQQGDYVIPDIVWSSGLNCRKIGRYQEFEGVWTYGEWGQMFKPCQMKPSSPIGNLYIDEAATNLAFDKFLGQRPSRYAGAEIYIRFRGNLTTQGRSDALNSRPLYYVRDISEVRLMRNFPNAALETNGS